MYNIWERERELIQSIYSVIRHQSSMSSSSIKTVIWFAWKCYKRMLLVPYYLASIGNEYIDMNKDKKRASFTQKLYSLSFLCSDFQLKKDVTGSKCVYRSNTIFEGSFESAKLLWSGVIIIIIMPFSHWNVRTGEKIVIVSVLIIDISFLLFLWLGLFRYINLNYFNIYEAWWNTR
jgi:hypothetical protein